MKNNKKKNALSGAKKSAKKALQLKAKSKQKKAPKRVSKKQFKRAVKKVVKKVKVAQKASKKLVKKAVKKATPKKAVKNSSKKPAKKSAIKARPAAKKSGTLKAKARPTQAPARSASRSVQTSNRSAAVSSTPRKAPKVEPKEIIIKEPAESQTESLEETADPMPEVGTMAPVFTARDQDGMTRSLGDYLGKWVLLYFYPKDDSIPCVKEACGIRDSFAQFEDLETDVIGVSVDSVVSHSNFAQKHDLPHVLISDENHRIVNMYGVWAKKSYMGREYMGTLRTSFLINPEGRIAKVYEAVDPETHAEEVLEDLRDLTSMSDSETEM